MHWCTHQYDRTIFFLYQNHKESIEIPHGVTSLDILTNSESYSHVLVTLNSIKKKKKNVTINAVLILWIFLNNKWKKAK